MIPFFRFSSFFASIIEKAENLVIESRIFIKYLMSEFSFDYQSGGLELRRNYMKYLYQISYIEQQLENSRKQDCQFSHEEI